MSGASCQRADGTEHAARLSDLKTLTILEGRRDPPKGGTSHMAKKAAKKAAKKTAKKR